MGQVYDRSRLCTSRMCRVKFPFSENFLPQSAHWFIPAWAAIPEYGTWFAWTLLWKVFSGLVSELLKLESCWRFPECSGNVPESLLECCKCCKKTRTQFSISMRFELALWNRVCKICGKGPSDISQHLTDNENHTNNLIWYFNSHDLNN